MSFGHNTRCYLLSLLFLFPSNGVFGRNPKDCSTGSVGLVTMTPEFLESVAASLPASRPNACDLSDGSCNSPPMACNSTCCLSCSNSEAQTCGCLGTNDYDDNRCSDPKRMQVLAESCPVDSTDNQHQVNVEVAQVPLSTPCNTWAVMKTTVTKEGKLQVVYTTVQCIRQKGSLRDQYETHEVVQTMITNTGFFTVENVSCTPPKTNVPKEHRS